MKLFLIFVLLLGVPAMGSPQETRKQNPEIFHIGLSLNTLGNIDSNDYKAAFKSWIRTVGKELALPMTADVKVVEMNDALQRMLRQEKLDGLTLTVKELMTLNLQPESVFVTRQTKGIDVRYALIVRRDGGITDLSRLKNGRTVTHNGHRMVLAHPWLMVSMSAALHGQGGTCIDHENLVITENAAKSILQVFFRQADAALVEENAFELACELNPQLKKELALLTLSPPFIPSFFLFLPNYRGKCRRVLEKALTNVHNTPSGRQILSIFQSSNMEKQPASILQQTQAFLKTYQRLSHDGDRP